MNALAILALVQAVAISGRLQGGVTVRPDTVRVGDPFVVSIRVRAPLGSTIEFPSAPDSNSIVEPLDPVQVTTTADSVGVDQTATYRLAAWRVGGYGIRFDDVIVTQDVGTRRLSVSGAGVTVVSVLPDDGTAVEPKPPRPVFTFGLPPWIWAIAVALAVAVLSLLAWLWSRRRRKRPVPRLAPFAVAEREFGRIEAIGLLAAGERARHVTLMVEVLRDFIAAVVPGASVSQTSNEMSTAMRRAGIGTFARCAALLAEVDMIKFARRPLTAERAAALGAETRAVAAAIHAAQAAAEKSRAA